MSSDAAFPIVGIGASAGGLRALEGFFKPIPADPGMAFLIITHLAPDRNSFLSEILARYTSLPVEEAHEDQKVEKNHVYVLPPHASLTIKDGRLKLLETDTDFHQRAPIDLFFASLAEDCAEYAVGVILSGSGTDGVLGVKAIKERGGLVLAQASDGSGPGFSGMPESAIASGLVDFAVPVEAMAEKLLENCRSIAGTAALFGDGPKDSVSHDALEAICAQVRAQTGHDFSGYKNRTVLRRIARRMQIMRCATLADYAALVQSDANETTLLFRDLLINVTAFFRDPDAFNGLETLVIPRLLEGRGAADQVRVWVPGCATGEEVISLAILLIEQMDRMRAPPRLTIFATDIDESALAVARAGRYPQALLEGVSPERRQRFFTNQAGSYVLAKQVRDICVFSPHSLLRDPPFSRMDLISCRNLLIYFSAEAQRQVLPIFHYALRPGGYLFLGKSETIGRFSELFAPIDKTNCIFQARDTGAPPRMPLFSNGPHPASFSAVLAQGRKPVGGGPLRLAAEARIVERFSPAHVVVNEDGDILHFSTRTGKFLEAPYGAPTRQLLNVARKDLRLDLRNILRAAIDTRRPATKDNIAFDGDDGRERISLTVEPLPDSPDGRPLFLVVFEERLAAAGDATAVASLDGWQLDEDDNVAQLRRELSDTRQRLQGAIEEYETSLEELKSANEELISLNEEMQSSNEELESTKEELQSLNEELQTVNHELCAKIEDLDRANGDLANLFASTNVATIFLDRHLVIRSFTPAVSQLFNIIASDKGRPLGDLAIKLDYPDLQNDINAVLTNGAPIEKRVHEDAPAAPYYLARLTPYRDASQVIDGVVASFVDVTTLAKAEERQRLLVAEVNHRVKNTLTVITAIARLTSMQAKSPQEFASSFLARLHALARSHELLSRENWEDVEIEEVLRQALSPYAPAQSPQATLAGPAIKLPAKIALSLGMIIDELSTNAVKYGAWSKEAGKIAIEWSAGSESDGAARKLRLSWTETGGPPASTPEKIGFGLSVIRREVEYSLHGSVKFDFATSGFVATLDIPLP